MKQPFALPLAGIIDLDAEKARLEKDLDKIAKVAEKIREKAGQREVRCQRSSRDR